MNAGRWTGIALMLLGVAACTSVLAQPGIARIAFMANADDASTRSVVDAFRSGLGELGQVEGRTYVLDIRYGLGRSDRYPALVAEAIERGTAVIVTSSYPATLAAKQATREIPIVGFSCGLELLVDSLARPGGNVTGVTCQSVGSGRQAAPTLATDAAGAQAARGAVQPRLAVQ